MNNKDIGADFKSKIDKILRTTALDTQGRMKKLTPVDTGQLRASVQMEVEGDEARVFNNLPYAQRVYLEGHSKQLPQGEFQAFVAGIPQRMDEIARGVMR